MNINPLRNPPWVRNAFLALGLTAAIGVHGAESVGQTNTMPVRIGTYDSRAIAIAFCGSAAHEQQLDSIKADYDRAKAAGDEKRMAQIKARMQAGQKLMHQQGFSTEPVDDLLKHIEGSLEKIKQTASVSAILSKWDTAALEKTPSAEKIDVTMLLVEEFHPNDRQRKFAIDIQKRKPITLKEAKNIRD